MKVGYNHPVRCINVFSDCVSIENEPNRRNAFVKKPTWQLTCDPSGDFVVGNLFNYSDIELGLSNVWDAGTRFQNTVTGKIIELRTPAYYKLRGRHTFVKNLQIRYIK
jgi:hypothetical protein